MYDNYWKWLESAAYFPGIWFVIEGIFALAALLTFVYVTAWGITSFAVYLATRCCCKTSSSTPSPWVCCWKPQEGGRNARAVFLGLGLAAVLGSVILAAAYVPPAHSIVTRGLDVADRGATFLETISASVSALRIQTVGLVVAFDTVILTNGTQSLTQQERDDLTANRVLASGASASVRFADEALQNGYAKMIRNYTDDVTTYADDYRALLDFYTAWAVAVTVVFCLLVAFTSWPVLFAGESVDPSIGWSDDRKVNAEESLPLTGRTGVSKSPSSSCLSCSKAGCCRASASVFDIATILAFCVVALIAFGTFGAGGGLQTASIVLSDACEDPRAFLSDDRLKINSVAYHYAVCDDPEGGAVNLNLDDAARFLDDTSESVVALYNSTRGHPHLSVSTAWLLANLTDTRTAIATVRQSALCTTTSDLVDDVLGLLCDDSVEVLFVASIVLVVGTGMALVVSSVLATRCCTRCACCKPRMASEPSACVWPCRGPYKAKPGSKPGDLSMGKFTPVMPRY